MSDPAKLLPMPDADSAPYWASCRRHRMELQRCVTCGSYRFPPSPLCPQCLSDGAAWTPVSGEGVVYVALTCVRAPHPGWEKDVPYNVSLIDLREGVRVWGNVLGVPADVVRIGDRVTLTYDDVTPEVTLPRWVVEGRL